jgi:NAD(P)-dependent dehydrogenase (short-subunit alcohol dehydrogenase family)
VDRRRDHLQEAFRDQIPEGDGCYYAQTDLIDPDSVAGLANEVQERFGRVDALINIAGGFKPGAPVHETSLEDWEFLLNLNARTAFLTCRAFVPHMLSRRYGKIVNVSARAALSGKAKMAAYVISKSAVIRLTESMAAELRDEGINVNCILPGTIDTPRNRQDMPNADFTKWVPPEQMASVIVFLCSQAAAAVNGAAVPVYGRS